MKTIVYLAITASGLITRSNEDTSFVSEASWESYDRISREAGTIIMGKNTFDLEVAEGNFPYPDRLNVVMSSQPIENTWGDGVWITNLSPKEVVDELSKRGHATAFVAGGAALATSFLCAGVVDELYLDVEPTLSGAGLALIQDEKLQLDLDLLEITKLSDSTVQLRYVVKND